MRRITLLWIFASMFAVQSIAEATPRSLPTVGVFFSSNQRFFLQVRENRPFQVFDRQNPQVPIWEFAHKNAFNTSYLVSDDGEVVVDLTLWDGGRQNQQTPFPDTVCMTFINRQGVFRTRVIQDFFFHASNASPRRFLLSFNPWFREPKIQGDVFSLVTDEDRQFDISIKTGNVMREQPAPLDRVSQPTRIMIKTLIFGGAFAVCVALVGFGLLRNGHTLEVD